MVLHYGINLTEELLKLIIKLIKCLIWFGFSLDRT